MPFVWCLLTTATAVISLKLCITILGHITSKEFHKHAKISQIKSTSYNSSLGSTLESLNICKIGYSFLAIYKDEIIFGFTEVALDPRIVQEIELVQVRNVGPH